MISTRRSIVLLFGIAVCYWAGTHGASPSLARQSDNPDSSKSEEKALNIQYAQAQLKLAEARLAELEERNRRVPNTIRPAVIELLQDLVDKSRIRLESAKSDETNYSQLYVARAEVELRMAEESLKRAETLNARRPNTVIAGEVARLAARRDLAKVRIAKARHLASESPLSNLQFEIDELRESVQELRLQELMSRRGS